MKTLLRTIVLLLAFTTVSRVEAQSTYVNFDSMPVWTSSYYFGSDAMLSIVPGGSSDGTNKCLLVKTDTSCYTIRTITGKVPSNAFMEVSGYLKSAASSNNYKIKFAFRSGTYSAANFTDFPSQWTEIVSFSNTTVNGNYDTWTGYFGRYTTGPTDSTVTVVISYISDSAMSFNFDDLLINRVPPLPVNMISFSAEKFGDGVNLLWSTATEINNLKFDVMRSIDGKSFVTIGTVAGNGNSNTILDYSYMDNAITAYPVIYYRLKQTDYNGKFTYTDIIKVKNNEEISASIKVYPNPYEGQFNWEFATVQGKKYTLKMYDMTGKLVYKENIENATMGTIKPNVALPHGIYMLSLNDETSVIQNIKLEH